MSIASLVTTKRLLGGYFLGWAIYGVYVCIEPFKESRRGIIEDYAGNPAITRQALHGLYWHTAAEMVVMPTAAMAVGGAAVPMVAFSGAAIAIDWAYKLVAGK